MTTNDHTVETPPRYGCVLLAAGLGKRFGGDKLRAELEGVPLYASALDAVPLDKLHMAAAVAWDLEILAAARERGLLGIWNDAPEAGLSRSVRLGVEALADCDGLLFMVADQPLLRRETAARLLDAARENPGRIVVARRPDGRPGNPCFFPAAFYDELRGLEGDHGGRSVIAANPDALCDVAVEARELYDVDSREALEEIAERAHKADLL